MLLIIDSAKFKQAKIALSDKGKIIEEKSFIGKAENLLPEIDKLLKNHQLKINDLKAIAVNRGPGSYTGLRVGISIANGLGYALKIPIYGYKDMMVLEMAERIHRQLKKGKGSFDFPLPYYEK